MTVHPGYAAGSRRNARPPAVIETRAAVRPSVYTATDGRDMLVNSPDGWEVDKPWLWWQGPAGGDGTGGPLGNPPPGAGRPAHVPAAVTRCTSLICDTIAGLPWQVRRGLERMPTPPWIDDPQLLRMDARIDGGVVPATRRSVVEFRSYLLKSMLWRGEAMIYVPNRNADDSPAPPLWQLNPDMIAEEGGRYYVPGSNPVSSYLGDAGPDVRADYEFGPRELIVIRGMVDEGPRGLGVLGAHMWELALAGLIPSFAFNMLRRGVPGGYLKVNAPNLVKAKAEELQRNWMKSHGGLDRRIAVLNATTEFHALTMDPAALQLAQMRDYATHDVALVFGVPPYMLGLAGSGGRDTYANVESRMIELCEFTLLPWTRRVEASHDAELPRGTDMKINMDGLRRADTKTRYEAHKLGVDGGWLTDDEVREMEDRPPLTAEQRAQMAGPAAALPPAPAAPAAPPAPDNTGLRIVEGGPAQ
jgi:HK97 family phage portal protein